MKGIIEKQKELIEIQKQYIDWINRHEPNAPVSMRGKQMLLESIKIESELVQLQGEQESGEVTEAEVKEEFEKLKQVVKDKYKEPMTAKKWLQDKYPSMRGWRWNSTNIDDEWVVKQMEQYHKQRTREVSDEEVERAFRNLHFVYQPLTVWKEAIKWYRDYLLNNDNPQ